MTVQAQVAWELGAQLGEGPVWVERDAALWFTDIKQQKIHRFDPASGDRKSWDAPEQVGFVFPTRSGGYIAGLQSGLHRFDPGSGKFELIVEVDRDLPSNRLNDGVVDPSGRLWFGTMDNSEQSQAGAYYCFAGGDLKRTNLTGIAITNGPAISPDGSTLYWVDTIGGTLNCCDILGDGVLGPSELLVRVDAHDGNPDGPSVDCDGCIWVGLYSGWAARRYSPSGELLDEVRFPVSNITKIAFGGPGLRTAYATTARHLLSDEKLQTQPLAGALFEFPLTVPGLATYEVAD